MTRNDTMLLVQVVTGGVQVANELKKAAWYSRTAEL
jgi:hypothetical protein